MKVKENKPKKPQSKLNSQKTAKKSENQNFSKWVWFFLAGIFITTFIIYLKAIGYNLLLYWDDNFYITANDHIKDLNWTTVKLIFSNFYASNYQPLVMLFYAVEYKLGSGQAQIFHFINILFHLLNTYLVFVLVKKIAPKNVFVALITAAFFAVHPMHVESVAWVSERKDVMYSFFFLLGLVSYVKYLDQKTYKRLIITLIFFVLSCLSKSAAVVFPMVMLLIDYYLSRKIDRKMIFEKIPFFLVSLVFGFVALYSQKSSGVLEDWAPKMSFIEHMSVIAFSFCSYIFKAFIPINLSAIYPYPMEIGHTLPVLYYLSLLFVIIILFFVGFSYRWGKDILFGFLFFIITIILVLQFLPVGSAIMADRYTYIPYIGLFIIVGKVFDYFYSKAKNRQAFRKYSLAFLLFLFFIFSAVSFVRVSVWKNDETLFSDAINKYPNCSIAYVNRGNYYNGYLANQVYKGNTENEIKYINLAIKDFENAIKYELIPKNNWRAYFNLGLAHGNAGDIAGAVEDFNKSIELNADNRYGFLSRGVHYLNYYANNVYINDKAKREFYINKAVSDFESSLALSSSRDEKIVLYKNLGVAKVQLGDYNGAIRFYDKLIDLDPKNADAYVKRSDARYQIKDYQGAFDDCNKAIELDPGNTITVKNREIVRAILESSKK